MTRKILELLMEISADLFSLLSLYVVQHRLLLINMDTQPQIHLLVDFRIL